MEKQNRIVPAVVESEPAPQAGYTAPQMFAVAPTVELIQGENYSGPMDALNNYYAYPY